MGEPLWPTLGGLLAVTAATVAIVGIRAALHHLAHARLTRRWARVTAAYRRAAEQQRDSEAAIAITWPDQARG